MITRKEVFSVLKNRLPYLRHTFGVKRIAVFGSFARGTPKKNSDIDLLIEFSHTPGLEFITLTEYLEKYLGKKVEILTPAGLKGIRITGVAREIKKSLQYV